MNNKLKIKDILLIALLTAVYMILYFITMMVIMPLGAFGHAISPGICGLLAGTVIYFMARKVGKMWQFTLMTLLTMGVFALMGGGYLPWLISSTLTAILADLIASRSKETPVLKIAVSSALMHMGQAWGAIIPTMFFVDRYREEWISRGQTAEAMDNMIRYTAGKWGAISSVVVFALAFAGVYMGYLILRKHFREV
ncbi:MAG: MptD family putative ECF transporter S component [Peptostreptococcaceae bacterium]|nr:MptD family putative ECF transporter S component [Peptostreptococcaceae bacterium]